MYKQEVDASIGTNNCSFLYSLNKALHPVCFWPTYQEIANKNVPIFSILAK